MFFIVAYGFVINDCVDYKKDSQLNSTKPLQKGTLTIKQALVLAFTFLIFSFAFSLQLTKGTILFTAIATLLSLYSFVNKKFGVIANILVAILCVLIMLFGVNDFSSGNVNILVGSMASAFFFMLGREIILDIKDKKADSAIGKSSICLYFGNETAIILCIISTFIAILISFITGLIGHSASYFAVISIIACVYTAYMAFQLYKEQEKGLEKFISHSYIPFALAIISISLSRFC